MQCSQAVHFSNQDVQKGALTKTGRVLKNTLKIHSVLFDLGR